MLKISFVLPVKNGERFIETTIRSMLKQNYQACEIVVVNDHSEDKTLDILNSLASKNKNLLILNNPENESGVAAARNLGTEKASGEIIFPSDADDPNFPERARVSISELQKNKADVFYSNLERFYQDSGKKELRHFQPYDPVLLKYINYIAHAGSSAYYKYVWEKVGGYDEEIKIGEDWDFWLKSQQAGFKFCFKNIPLAQYTMHAGQSTNTADREKIKNRQYWNRVVREKHGIYEIDLEYVKNHTEPSVREFYVDKNFEIWFEKESIPNKI